MESDGAIGYGIPPNATFWIAPADGRGLPGNPRRVRGAGPPGGAGVLRGGPGPGAEVLYEPGCGRGTSPSCYGAFVHDPDGNNIEAVCRSPDSPPRRNPRTGPLQSTTSIRLTPMNVVHIEVTSRPGAGEQGAWIPWPGSTRASSVPDAMSSTTTSCRRPSRDPRIRHRAAGGRRGPAHGANAARACPRRSKPPPRSHCRRPRRAAAPTSTRGGLATKPPRSPQTSARRTMPLFRSTRTRCRGASESPRPAWCRRKARCPHRRRGTRRRRGRARNPIRRSDRRETRYGAAS